MVLSLFDLAGGVVVSHYNYNRIYLPTTIKLKLTIIEDEINILRNVSKKLEVSMASCKSTMLHVIGMLASTLVLDSCERRYCIIINLRSVICNFLGDLYFALNDTRYLKPPAQMATVVRLIQHAICLMKISAPTSDVYTEEMCYLTIMIDRWTLLSLTGNAPNIFIRIVREVEEPVDKSAVQEMIRTCQLKWGEENPNNRCVVQEMIRICEPRWFKCVQEFFTQPPLPEFNNCVYKIKFFTQPPLPEFNNCLYI